MKKCLAILLLALLLFQVGGYHLFFWSLRAHAKKDLLKRLDAEEYSADEVAVLSLPVNLPYVLNESGFVPAQGEVEYKGQYYNLVKQMIKNDTLFMVCIKDNNRAALEKTIGEYTNIIVDVPAPSSENSDLLGKIFKDYTFVYQDVLIVSLSTTGTEMSGPTDLVVSSPFLQIDSPPPQFHSVVV